MRVPLGVVGIIYESRPERDRGCRSAVSPSGNATVLRGGSEAFTRTRRSPRASPVVCKAAGLPSDAGAGGGDDRPCGGRR